MPLDVKAPLAERLASKGIRLLTSMSARWSYEGDNWYYRAKNVLVTSDGIFGTRRHERYGSTYQPESRITQTLGTHVAFEGLGIAKSHDPDKDGDEWLQPYIKIKYSSGRYDLEANGTDSIVFDLPDEELASYERGARREANKQHGLSERFSWFPDVVAEEYSDYVIDEARLVEKSLVSVWTDSQYTLRGGPRDVSIKDRLGYLFSFKNAPKRISEGYKLLLAFHGLDTRLKGLDSNLCAYLETSAPNYDYAHRQEDAFEFPSETREPVW